MAIILFLETVPRIWKKLINGPYTNSLNFLLSLYLCTVFENPVNPFQNNFEYLKGVYLSFSDVTSTFEYRLPIGRCLVEFKQRRTRNVR